MAPETDLLIVGEAADARTALAVAAPTVPSVAVVDVPDAETAWRWSAA